MDFPCLPFLALASLAFFLFLPGHPLSHLGGLPWGPLALVCGVLLALGTFAAWPLERKPWCAKIWLAVFVLAGLKLLLALTAPRYGLEASYYDNERFGGTPERSTASPGTPFTRIDTQLDFGSDEFPLYFFNDSERFNVLGPDRLDRGRTLTWSASWSGYLNVTQDGPTALWLTASGPAELSLDGRRLLRVDADGRATAEAEQWLGAGPHALQVRYVRKKERSGYLKVESDLAGLRRPLGGEVLTALPYSPERMALDRSAALLARSVDLGYLALLVIWLTASLWRRLRAPLAPSESRWARYEQPLLALVPLGFFLQAALPRLDRFGKMVFLGGGQDWLTHETLARDIQLNGPLMTLGEPLGRGALYYAQPLYPYYLALLHILAGEDLYGPTTLQALGLGVASVLVYALARRLFRRSAAFVALAIMLLVLVPFELAWVARLLISEALYFWLIPAAVLALLCVASSPTWRRAAAAGVLLGLACLTRGPTLLYLPPAALLLWLTLRRQGCSRSGTGRVLAILGLCAALLIGLVPLRNAIVAGKPALTAASGGVNLEKFHRPSDAVRLRDIDRDPLQRLLDVDRPTREVIEYLRQDPISYFASYLPLAAYTLGVGSALNHLLDEQPVPLQPELLVLNALYLLAVLSVTRARSLPSGFLHAFIAVHFLTMVVFTPYDYENRLVMPMYLFITVFAAAALVRFVPPR